MRNAFRPSRFQDHDLPYESGNSEGDEQRNAASPSDAKVSLLSYCRRWLPFTSISSFKGNVFSLLLNGVAGPDYVFQNDQASNASRELAFRDYDFRVHSSISDPA
jgi:hypothetical protein